jgi:predicted N-acetyltransferase YhbS
VITFEPLARHPDHIHELSQWMFQKWGKFYPGSSVETTRRWLNMTMRDSGLPITQLALEDETLVGCAMLQQQELYKEKNLTPWLGALLVKEKYQDQGIGSHLHGWAIAHTKSLNYKKLHLLTFDLNHCEWYHRKGWAVIKSDHTRGHPLIVMETAVCLFADNTS